VWLAKGQVWTILADCPDHSAKNVEGQGQKESSAGNGGLSQDEKVRYRSPQAGL